MLGKVVKKRKSFSFNLKMWIVGKKFLCKEYKRCKDIKQRNSMAQKSSFKKFDITNSYIETERVNQGCKQKNN